MTKKKYKDPEFTISKVYTKTGDGGTTSLVGGQKVPKTNLRINAYGEVDELNSIIGICIEELKVFKKKYKQFDSLIQSLFRIQNDLFNLGTILATIPDDMTPSMPRVTNDDIDILEQKIDEMNTNSGLEIRISKQDLIRGKITFRKKDSVKLTITIPVYKKNEIGKIYREILNIR